MLSASAQAIARNVAARAANLEAVKLPRLSGWCAGDGDFVLHKSPLSVVG